MLLSSREKILLHLYLESRNLPLPARVMPNTLSQEGISLTTGVARKHIPRNLKALIGKGFISESKAHIKGAAQRRKVYFTTPEGRDEAEIVKEKALTSKIILSSVDEDREMSLEDAWNEMQGRLPEKEDPGLLFLIRCLREESGNEILEIEKSLDKITTRKRSVKHISSAPIVREFVGRDKEKGEVSELWNDSKMVVVYGITGIGKSAFGSQLARDHDGNVFWHLFHEWDTLQNLQLPLGTFLDEIGKGRLLKDGDIDVNETLGVLRDGLSGSNAMIVLDDVQKAPESFIPLLTGLVESLQNMEDVKFLILSRKIPDFYSRKDVKVKKTVSEYMLSGLDRKSCYAMLHIPDLSETELEEIYRITCGHPLSLELIEQSRHGIDVGDLEHYFEEEILRKLPASEKKLLQLASVYRYPVPSDALLLYPEEDYENLSDLSRHALILQTADGKYLLHDLLKGFISTRLSPHQRTELNTLAASYYRSSSADRRIIETIYHLIQACKYDDAAKLFLENGRELIFGGYGIELHDNFTKIRECDLTQVEKIDILTLHAEIDTVMGDWKGAEEHLTLALDQYRALGNDHGMALVLKDLGGLYLRKGNAEKSVDMFTQSLTYYMTLEDMNGIAQIQNNLGIAYWRGGDIPKARESLQGSLEISERIEDDRGIARSITNLGIIEFDHGDLDKAIDYYNRALKLSEKLGDRKTLAQLYDNLGEAYHLKDDREKALEFFDQGISLAEDLGFRLIAAQLYQDMSHVLEGSEREYYRGLAREIYDDLGVKDEESKK